MFPIGIKSFIVYLEGFVTVCTASLVSFQACLDVFGLTGDGEDVKLLVVATQEGE